MFDTQNYYSLRKGGLYIPSNESGMTSYAILRRNMEAVLGSCLELRLMLKKLEEKQRSLCFIVSKLSIKE